MIQQAAPVNLVICSGEPAGVGPEISLAAALAFFERQPAAHITILCDPSLFSGLQNLAQPNPRLTISTVRLASPVKLGHVDPSNAQYVLDILDIATNGCLEGRYAAMVTAPLQKSVINDGTQDRHGLFTGHTEYLAKLCHQDHVVMMLCANIPAGFLSLSKACTLRVALATTHLPLKEVSSALQRQHITQTIAIVHHDLQHKFAIANPRIRVAGLNPHAGESGYLGREELEIIAPAIEDAKALGIDVIVPLPGDTMFDAGALDKVDAFIAMYHDQGLAPFKFVSFGGGVNVTLGLPIIRTSVDHGTALEIAGKGIADFGSMLEALDLAYQLAITSRGISR